MLETIRITNTPTPGLTRQNHSPWLFLDAAHTIFSTAKDRVYVKEAATSQEPTASSEMPEGIKVVLEPLPKWTTLKEVLGEIENEIYLEPKHGSSIFAASNIDDGTNATLVMCTDERTCKQLREYLQLAETNLLMQRKLRDFFYWKANFQKTRLELFVKPQETKDDDGIFSNLMSNVDSAEDPRLKMKRKGIPPNKRRRVRGGAVSSSRTAAGVIEIPDDNPTDIAEM